MTFHILAIVAVSLFFYLRTFNYGYVSDDCHTIKNSKYIPRNFPTFLWAHIRGLTYHSSRLAHLLSTLIHTLNCVLIYLAFGRTQAAFIASLLFCVNPVNTQGGSIWISGKCYAISATCALLMFIMPVIAPVFYAAGLYWAFSSVPSILFFIPTPYWWWALALPVAIVVFRKRIFAIQLAGKEVSAPPVLKEIRPYKLIIFFKTFGYYTQLCLFPLRLGHYHTFLYLWGVSKDDNAECLKINWPFFKGVIIFCSVMVLMAFNWRNPVGLGLWWWLMGIVMWCNIVTVQQVIAERYCYLPNIGLMLAVVSLVLRLPAPYPAIVFSVMGTFYGLKLWLYTPAYRYELELAKANSTEFPNFYHVYQWIGMIYKDTGRRYEALGWLMDAINLRPLDFKTLFNTSILLGELGYLTDAYTLLEKAKQARVPDTTESHMLDIIEKRQKSLKEAIAKIDILKHNKLIEMAKRAKGEV